MASSSDPCHSLRPVLCLFSPWSPHPPPPCPLSPTNKRTSWMRRRRRRRWGGEGTSFMTSLPFFSSSLPFGFQAHSFLPRPRESGGHHLYRCLGIKAPWPLLLRGGLGQRWLGQRGEGQGRAALCSSQQSGLQFPQTWELTGGPPAA